MKTSKHFTKWLAVLLLIAVNAIEVMAQGPYTSAAAPHSVCLNSTEPYGVILTTGSSYVWSIDDNTAGTIAAGATPNLITVNWTKAGNYILEVIETNQYGCIGNPVTINIKVNPLPRIANKTAIICSAEAFAVSPVDGTGSDIVPAGTTYSWSAPTVVGITGTASGTDAANISGTLTNTTSAAIDVEYTVTPKSGDCTGANFTVTVTVNPKATIANKTTTACSAEAFAVSPEDGTDIVPTGTTYTWTAPVVTGITGLASGTDAANISGTLTNTTNAAINVEYTVTPKSGGCTGASFTVTVTVNPKATIANKTAAICSGDGFAVSPVVGTASDIVPAGTTYSWTAPSVVGITGTVLGSDAANISGTLTNTTTAPIDVEYTVTPKSGGCTGASFTVTVTVYPPVNTSPIYHN